MRKLPLILLVLLFTFCKSQQPAEPEAIEEHIKVIQPEFNIVSIAIIQADLINTEFEAVVRIDNPNEFNVKLSSLDYELYGNNSFWASGKGEDVLNVPANNSCETEFRFTMNFINMNRRLLDDIIAMQQVRYRFKGAVEVEADIKKIPPFNMSFECSGLSEVKKKTE